MTEFNPLQDYEIQVKLSESFPYSKKKKKGHPYTMPFRRKPFFNIHRFPGGSVVKNLSANAVRFNPWVGKIPRKRKWQPPPVFLPGKTHEERSLVGYSSWGHKRVGHDLATK